MSEKLKLLNKVNEKLANVQNAMRIQLEYDNGCISTFDVLKEEDVWVTDDEFGKGSKYKTLKQYNKAGIHDLSPVLFEGKKGNVVETHTHRESHLFICLDGEIKVTLDDKNDYLLTPTQSIYVNSFQPHRFEFLSDSKIIILVLNI